MNYAILRAEKLTSFGSITSSSMHTFRELPTPNADASRTPLNKTWGAMSATEVRRAVNARLPTKRRKDAVLCIEYLITASPEWFEKASLKRQNYYFATAVQWLKDRHGEENVVCLNIQNDERSPHLVAYVVPLTKDGRLSAKDFLGGRKILTEMQTEFSEKVGRLVGLQRGIQGSKAVHTTAKQYNAAMKKNPTLVPPIPPTLTLADRFTGKANQKEAEHKAAQAKYAALVENARNESLFGRHARERQAAALKRLREDLEDAQQQAADAERLRKENDTLRQRGKEQEKAFATEKRSLMETIAGLQAQLRSAIAEIKRIAARILFLEDRLFPPAQKKLSNMEEKEKGFIFKP